MWFAESGCYGGTCYIGRITTDGVITNYAIPTADAQPWSITGGPDGALWFTEISADQIGRITSAGVVTEFPVPSAGSGPNGIASGPEGALWFTEAHANKIGKITTDGEITEYPVSLPDSIFLGSITPGPDGALCWTASTKAGSSSKTATPALEKERSPSNRCCKR